MRYSFLFYTKCYNLVLVLYLHTYFCLFCSCRCFLPKSNLAFLFLNETRRLNFVVNPLYVHSWRRHLIMLCLSASVFLNLLDAVKLFLTKKIILWSLAWVVFCGLSRRLMLFSCPVHSFTLRMCQIVGSKIKQRVMLGNVLIPLSVNIVMIFYYFVTNY